VNHAPHTVILGAGASIAAYVDWGKKGNALPSMQDLIDVLSLRNDISSAGYKTENLNFEAFYDDLATADKNDELKSLVESRVYSYFASLSLPETPTIYDYLVLGLREKDIIASFNWDPFLLQAYMRNEVVTKTRRPRIAFLHGNVMIGRCDNDRVSGINGRRCSRCDKALQPSSLLYPVKHKDYTTDKFIKGEWDALREHLNRTYYLTVYGYSAPVTDVEARKLMLEVWKDNKSLELAEVDIVDVKSHDELERNWEEFFVSHHYMITDDIFRSYLFTHPRRSCDAFASATLMCDPWHDNPFPKFKALEELQEWVKPLIDEEELYDSDKKAFSGSPLPPNKKMEL
jgi:hypothetical protein